MNIATIRIAFSDYLRKRYPNDNHTGSTVSMAFFLYAHEADLGLGFADVLSGTVAQEIYRDRLVAFFTANKRKNPKGNASVYLHSLKLLREFLGDLAVEAPANSVAPARQTS